MQTMIGMIANQISEEHVVFHLNFIHWYRANVRVGGASDRKKGMYKGSVGTNGTNGYTQGLIGFGALGIVNVH